MASETTPSASLADLTCRMAQGEDEAWQRFHEQYGPTVFRILLGLTKGDPHVATEALQKTYLRVSRHVRVCDCEVMWVSWLRIVARSALCDVLRGRYRFWNLIKHHQYSVPEDRAMTAPETDVLARLDTALAQLSPEIQLLLQRKYFRGESVRSIADSLGITVKAAESRLLRGRAELKERMRQLSDISHDEQYTRQT